ncbi:MAG: diguanylate cyclase [candidate division WOR-3 bacterium]
MNILIVDDSRDELLLLKRILSGEEQVSIYLAETAEEAFDILGIKEKKKRKKIDLILMDIRMPKVDGLEACRIIKADEELGEIPIIMVTGQKDDAHLQASFEVGANDYITKPINKIELISRVRLALKLKEEIEKRKKREQELLEITKKLDEANKKLKQMSYLDGLTSIPNRRYFEEFFRREWRHAIRAKTPISLIMFDIDYFKAYNDTYGHLNGDECLKKLAFHMSSLLKRPRDFLCRYGGEEFIAVLPETDERGAFEVASRFLRETEKLKIAHKASKINKNVTISIGIATTIPTRKGKPNRFVEEVDKALYQAKRSGRNCIKIAKSKKEVKRSGGREKK